MIPLENCPYCHGPGQIKDVFTKFRHGWVGCPDCKVYFSWVHDPYDAIKKWNTWACDNAKAGSVC